MNITRNPIEDCAGLPKEYAHMIAEVLERGQLAEIQMPVASDDFELSSGIHESVS